MATSHRVGETPHPRRPAPAQPHPLAGRTAVVVGATRGIGSVVAETLAIDGSNIVLAARDEKALGETAGRLEEAHPEASVLAVTCDVCDEDAVAALADATVGRFGGVDILVPAAGVTGPIETPLSQTSVEDFRQVLDVNVTGTFLCCRAMEPWLRVSPHGGRIVTFSSTAGLRGYANRVAYSSSKWAIRGLTRALARELGRVNITVNSVSPYTVHGARMAEVVEGKAARLGVSPQQVYDDFTRTTALGRWVDESDVADVIRFLVSDAARNVTGQDIAIDAGWDA